MNFTPVPQIFALFAVMFTLSLVAVLTAKCLLLLPVCPVTSIVPLGPIGLCRVDYVYTAGSTTYGGSMVLGGPNGPACPAINGYNHTVSVCYDTRHPARHEVSTDASYVSPHRYFAALTFVWISSMCMALLIVIGGCMMHEHMSAAAAISIPPQQQYIEVARLDTMSVEPPPVPDLPHHLHHGVKRHV